MDSVEAQSPPGEMVLDPFSYVPDMASRVEGLGGHDRPAEGDYVFHTPYVEVAEGVAHFTIEFHALSATTGTLNLRVHMLSDDSPHARLATAERIAFNRLVLLGGRHQFRFEAFHGARYALYGGLIGDTDARAGGARVILDRPADPNQRREIAAEARNTHFQGDARAVPHLIALGLPLLSAPVTQLATVAQLKEAAARDWTRSLDVQDDLARWRAIYILQALKAYGLMDADARGAGLGYHEGPVAAALAAAGLRVDLFPGYEGVEVGDGPMRAALHIAGRDELDQRVAIRGGALDPIDPAIVNYDFIWSDGLANRLGDAARGERFVEAAMACIRPGGLAIHVVDFDAEPDGEGAAFGRGHLERICLILISRGHEVAEFRIDPRGLLTDDAGRSAAGLVCRKATLSA